MQSIYANGLMTWNEREILKRNQLIDIFAMDVRAALLEMNPAWKFYRVETPLLIPHDLLNPVYSVSDVYVASDLMLRPETTQGSYAIAKSFFESGVKPPLVVWQSGLSFRREQDQVVKNMRLKQFYQQEFQCFYTKDTLNDYQKNLVIPLQAMFESALKLPIEVADSDRLPGYSLKTIDFMANGMEICSCSVRTDFTEKVYFVTKNKEVIEREFLILEIAIGLDRCVYQEMTHVVA